MFTQTLSLYFTAFRLRWALNKWRLAPCELAHTFFKQASIAPVSAMLFIMAGFFFVWLMIGSTLFSLWLVRIHPPLESSLIHTFILQHQSLAPSRYAHLARYPTIRSSSTTLFN